VYKPVEHWLFKVADLW
jgi:hypothetical protein